MNIFGLFLESEGGASTLYCFIVLYNSEPANQVRMPSGEEGTCSECLYGTRLDANGNYGTANMAYA